MLLLYMLIGLMQQRNKKITEQWHMAERQKEWV